MWLLSITSLPLVQSAPSQISIMKYGRKTVPIITCTPLLIQGAKSIKSLLSFSSTAMKSERQMLLHSSPTWTPIYLFLTFYKSTIFYLHYIHNITLMLCFILNADHCQINLFWSSRANICCCAAVLSMFP